VGLGYPQPVRAVLGARREAPDRYSAPSEATIRRTLVRLDAEILAGVIGAWLANRQGADRRRRAVAVDGKTLRGAGGDGHQLHLLAAMEHTSRRVLAQREVERRAEGYASSVMASQVWRPVQC
jgi:hypothetical protein